MDPKIAKMIQKLSDDLEKLKVAAAIVPETKQKKDKQRPKLIDICTKKSELMLFTKDELKAWLVNQKVDRLSSLNKEDLVKLVVKKLKASRSAASSHSSTAAPVVASEQEVTSAPTAVDHLDSVDDLIEPSFELSSESSYDPGLIQHIINLLSQKK
jgi:hypothetical protein